MNRVWIDALGDLKPRLRAMAKEAVPIRMDGSVVVLALPSKFAKVHLPTISGESAAIAAAVGARLGARLSIRVTLDDAGPGTSAAGADDDLSDEEAMAEHLTPGPQADVRIDSPVELAITAFGATVESETVRD